MLDKQHVIGHITVTLLNAVAAGRALIRTLSGGKPTQ
jgi:hypothetical protein